jgi:hypothetical protein
MIEEIVTIVIDGEVYTREEVLENKNLSDEPE